MEIDYCVQITTVSGTVYETFHKDFFEAIKYCVRRDESAKTVEMFRVPDFTNPICAMRIIK